MIHSPPGTRPTPGPDYLAPTRFLDHEAPSLRKFALETVAGATGATERAVKLFYAVRDGWRYDPFSMTLAAQDYVASVILGRSAGYCIPKALLLAASARAVTTEKLKDWMGSTYFMHHGYAVLYLEGQWVKAAPAFNIQLCDRFHVRPTEFDGRSDAVFQEYDARDRRHMQYVKDHGVWSDFPFEKVVADFRAFYPARLFESGKPGERFEDGKRVD